MRLHFLSCRAEQAMQTFVSYLLEINENVRQKTVKEFTENKVTLELPIYMFNRRMQPWIALPPCQHTHMHASLIQPFNLFENGV